MQRRQFLQSTTAGVSVAAVLAGERVAKASASERLQVGVVGAGGRAGSLNASFASNPECEVVAIADLDARKFPKTVADVTKRQGRKPRTEQDFRKLVDDPKIDVLVVGTPDHWHAIPTILAIQNGKDVYVEKPDGHNIEEGRRMIAAMRKHKKIVQMGSQHRSTTRLKSALEFIRTGALGKCLVAKAWESSRQGNIGNPPDGTPPAGIDYDFWLGPAPKRPFNPNRFHGRWRWFYDYGTGDLGNDGVHRLDIALAALNAAADASGDPQVGLPRTISATGGKWYFDDQQEWPDTLQANFEFAGEPSRMLTYEMRVWNPYSFMGESEGAAVFGDKGYIIIGNSRWRAYGPRNRLLKEGEGGSHEAPHVQNFVDCVKSRKKPNCDLETVGHRASVLCHAGNVAVRVGRTLQLDPETETFDDKDANAIRTRQEYRKPWVLPEV